MVTTSRWLEAAPLVIAHRGASLVTPENTLAAFRQALRLGAEAVELDAKLTRDGEVVCFHDRTLERTTGARGRPGDLTLAELRSLDAGRWKGDAFAGEKIPTLDEVLESMRGRALVNVELTDYWADQPMLAARTVAAVRRHAAERDVLFSSFQTGALTAVERIAPEIPRAHLNGPTWLAYRDRFVLRRADVQALHLHESLVRPERVDSVHRSGRRLHVYTVDAPETMARLWAEGVDGLITDAPDEALRTRKAA